MVSNIIAQQSAQYIGHRGCRGVYPENTIEGLKKAIQYGADGIEWDVVINKDDEIIISHEPYIDTTYCQLKDGVDDPKKNNIYKMSTGEIKAFDCGSKLGFVHATIALALRDESISQDINKIIKEII